MPSLPGCPVEILLSIYKNLNQFIDAIHLAQSCKYLSEILTSPSHRWAILNTIINHNMTLPTTPTPSWLQSHFGPNTPLWKPTATQLPTRLIDEHTTTFLQQIGLPSTRYKNFPWDSAALKHTDADTEMAFWGEDELCGRDKLPGYGGKGMACYYIGASENRMALIYWTGLVVLGDAARIGRPQRNDLVAGSVMEFLVVLGTIRKFWIAVRGVDGLVRRQMRVRGEEMEVVEGGWFGGDRVRVFDLLRGRLREYGIENEDGRFWKPLFEFASRVDG